VPPLVPSDAVLLGEVHGQMRSLELFEQVGQLVVKQPTVVVVRPELPATYRPGGAMPRTNVKISLPAAGHPQDSLRQFDPPTVAHRVDARAA